MTYDIEGYWKIIHRLLWLSLAPITLSCMLHAICSSYVAILRALRRGERGEGRGERGEEERALG